MSLHSLRTMQEGWEREAKMSKRQLLPSRTSQSTEVSAIAWECGPSYRKSQEPRLGKVSWGRWGEAAPQQLSGVAKIPVLPEKEELGDGFHLLNAINHLIPGSVRSVRGGRKYEICIQPLGKLSCSVRKLNLHTRKSNFEIKRVTSTTRTLNTGYGDCELCPGKISAGMQGARGGRGRGCGSWSPCPPSSRNRQMKAASVIDGALRATRETGRGSRTGADCAVLESALRELPLPGRTPGCALPRRRRARGHTEIRGRLPTPL